MIRNGLVRLLGEVITRGFDDTEHASAEEGEGEGQGQGQGEEDEEEKGAPKVDKMTQDELFQLLSERVNDVTSFTRSKVLQEFTKLARSAFAN